MPVAVFENEPDAEATAVTLRELGFKTEVILPASNTFDERTKDFFQGKEAPFQPHAVVTSDADSERFVRTVQRHYGTVIGGDV